MNPSASLYIIGNGFDLYHDIPSDYRDFGRYLAAVDRGTYREVEAYFNVDNEFWWQFEQQLANFNTCAAIDYASQFLMPYGADIWSDSGHHDYQYELDRIIEAISKTLQERFAQWVRQLSIPSLSSCNTAPLPLDPNALYLSFNYTNTLQRTYGIPDSQILHIHGKASAPSDRLILGHGWERSASDSLNHGVDMSEADIRVIEGNEIVDRYFSATFKPTGQIIADNQTFFSNLKGIRQVYVMGHSLSEVDAPYYNEIIKNIDSSSVRWMISYRCNPTDTQEKFSNFGVDISLAGFAALDDAHRWVPQFLLQNCR
ncbi:hypothetical protein GCM10007933_09570 [Zoogloea oryzae]|uniref:Bacteriophage abortive infection AbiH n=1 Tax=Zoogloea oryzae TaxID=310767 RepID=A0ABQ6F7F6_9RHOO|nr:bacteriophage abortive infection AbiH family protein [Zoogloea oryzae]GLT21505.1 hypothetical protein GCM10007933_09570 [Zoogloea oryzae]